MGSVSGVRNENPFHAAWEAHVQRGALQKVTLHTLRHTFASWLVQRGRTLKEVQEALGHQTITMTMRYSHLAPDHLRAAVAVLDDVLPAWKPSESTAISTQASAQEPATNEATTSA